MKADEILVPVFCFSFVVVVVLRIEAAWSLQDCLLFSKKKVEEISMHVLCLGHSQLKFHGHDYLE